MYYYIIYNIYDIRITSIFSLMYNSQLYRISKDHHKIHLINVCFHYFSKKFHLIIQIHLNLIKRINKKYKQNINVLFIRTK